MLNCMICTDCFYRRSTKLSGWGQSSWAALRKSRLAALRRVWSSYWAQLCGIFIFADLFLWLLRYLSLQMHRGVIYAPFFSWVPLPTAIIVQMLLCLWYHVYRIGVHSSKPMSTDRVQILIQYDRNLRTSRAVVWCTVDCILQLTLHRQGEAEALWVLSPPLIASVCVLLF